jgi:raffinose/stachyose/melibiose transport system permease protein
MYLHGYKKFFIVVSLVLPGICLFLLVILFPIILNFEFSLTNQKSFAVSSEYLGFANYIHVFKDPVFWRSLMNALILGFCLILIQHPVCMFFAISLDKIGGRSEKIFRTMLFIPFILNVVVTVKMWVNVLMPTFGLLDKIMIAIGLQNYTHIWLLEPTYALSSIIFITMWQGFGMGMLLYYAGVKGIPDDVFEAAKIEGASGFQIATQITIPLLVPVIKVNTTLAIVGALKEMEKVFLSTNGAPGDRTQFLANYLYKKAFGSFEIGYASALAIVFIIVCVLASYLNSKMTSSEKIEY